MSCIFPGCGRPIYNGGCAGLAQSKCIFHADVKDSRVFRSELAKLILTLHRQRAKKWNFAGFVFVDRESSSNLFASSRFPAEVDFSATKFIGSSNFRSARFHGRVSFRRSSFIRGAYADFEDARLESTILMAYSSFSVLCNFTNAVIVGQVRLQWPGEGLKVESPISPIEQDTYVRRGRMLLKKLKFEEDSNGHFPLLDIRNNPLQDDCVLRIHECDMSHLLLARTDCRRIEFSSVQWPQIKGRFVVGDEYVLRTEPSSYAQSNNYWQTGQYTWRDIQKTYQELAVRYRMDLNHELANDFDRGVFISRSESARLQGNWFEYLLLRCYWVMSDYGGSLARPVVCAAIVLVVAATIYGFFLYGGHISFTAGTSIDIPLRSAIATLRIVVLDHKWFSTEVDSLVPTVMLRFLLTICATIEVLLVGVLATLFVFAVRRRFMH